MATQSAMLAMARIIITTLSAVIAFLRPTVAQRAARNLAQKIWRRNAAQARPNGGSNCRSIEFGAGAAAFEATTA